MSPSLPWDIREWEPSWGTGDISQSQRGTGDPHPCPSQGGQGTSNLVLGEYEEFPPLASSHPGGQGTPACPGGHRGPPCTCSRGQHPQAPELRRQHVFPLGQLVRSSHLTSPAGDRGHSGLLSPPRTGQAVAAPWGGLTCGQWRQGCRAPQGGAGGVDQVTGGALGTAVLSVTTAHGLGETRRDRDTGDRDSNRDTGDRDSNRDTGDRDTGGHSMAGTARTCPGDSSAARHCRTQPGGTDMG